MIKLVHHCINESWEISFTKIVCSMAVIRIGEIILTTGCQYHIYRQCGVIAIFRNKRIEVADHFAGSIGEKQIKQFAVAVTYSITLVQTQKTNCLF
ncbi:hypothetical protein MTP99_006934 [Tenebrio molitor]|nr:hypothetical protein MTP99_006934 [Tenebrio molitor]